ncbi:MAG TPA: molecular chaperone HtpG, partial [Flavobacteriaceae bacterium]|nr:molecular chaperone HtpG [Flavobacteriaceae bacterium]
HFARIDTDPIDKLIKKTDDTISKLSDEQKDTLKSKIEAVVASKEYAVQMEAMDSSAAPFMITEPEFMRRMKEMQQTGGGGMFGLGNMPDMYQLVVNTNHPLI